jgi:DNA-directed RNA polymerase specialized sigma subunit
MDGTPPTFCEASSAEDNIEAQLARHERLIHFAIRRYVIAHPDLSDDILAVGRAALAEAIQTYRADRGAALSTFACNLMRWRVSGFLSTFTRNDPTTSSLDEPRGEDEEGAFTLADVADAQSALREQSAGIADENLLRRISDLREGIATCTTLTANEREIVEAFLESGNGGMVAASLGLTPARVSQALASAAAKLRKHFQATAVHPSVTLATGSL